MLRTATGEGGGVWSFLETIVAPWFALAYGIWWFFKMNEEALKPAAKERYTRLLLGTDTERVTVLWPETFVGVFDSLFGEEHFTWKCFVRSCAASIEIVIGLAAFL